MKSCVCIEYSCLRGKCVALGVPEGDPPQYAKLLSGAPFRLETSALPSKQSDFLEPVTPNSAAPMQALHSS